VRFGDWGPALRVGSDRRDLDRERPVTALTTTTVITAPITETTIELMSSGPSIGLVLNSAPARNPPTRAPMIPRTM
jgi:hypothetical protein